MCEKASNELAIMIDCTTLLLRFISGEASGDLYKYLPSKKKIKREKGYKQRSRTRVHAVYGFICLESSSATVNKIEE